MSTCVAPLFFSHYHSLSRTFSLFLTLTLSFSLLLSLFLSLSLSLSLRLLPSLCLSFTSSLSSFTIYFFNCISDFQISLKNRIPRQLSASPSFFSIWWLHQHSCHEKPGQQTTERGVRMIGRGSERPREKKKERERDKEREIK